MTAASSRLVISQQQNFAASFGMVLRSSGIFWAVNSGGIKTTIAVTNYWQYKNSFDVVVLINLRELSGRLLQRLPVQFEQSAVFNYVPPAGFEGSVEVEAFSNINMRIPYAAVMAVYEAQDSVSMVHSYARVYSLHEAEDGNTITVGEESCWSLRESAEVESLCVFHNGFSVQPAQTVRLRIRNAAGEERTALVPLEALAPYQTVKVAPREYFPDIVDWLGGNVGNGRISFRLGNGFTRMLCIQRSRDGSQLQVTHSNFDYSTHATDFVGGADQRAWMKLPTVPAGFRQQLVIYPDMCDGRYRVEGEGLQADFAPGHISEITFADHAARSLQFTRLDGAMPTRVVTGVRLVADAATLPAECSLGMDHAGRPGKHYAWMLVSPVYASTICWIDYDEIYGGCPAEATLVFKYYTSRDKVPLTKQCSYHQLVGECSSERSITLTALLPAVATADDGFCWLTVWCSYGGLSFFSTLQKGRSISLEHAF